MTPFERVDLKSSRSKDERFHWNKVNAPITTTTVIRLIRTFVRRERLIGTDGGYSTQVPWQKQA